MRNMNARSKPQAPFVADHEHALLCHEGMHPQQVQ